MRSFNVVCHSRESGNPEPRHARPSLDARFRGHDTDVSESSPHFERLTRLELQEVVARTLVRLHDMLGAQRAVGQMGMGVQFAAPEPAGARKRDDAHAGASLVLGRPVQYAADDSKAAVKYAHGSMRMIVTTPSVSIHL